MQAPETLERLETPALVLDADLLEANLRRMSARARELGVTLRQHVKTHKSPEVGRLHARIETGGDRTSEVPLTVSTLREAEAFAAEGFRDILYAVGMAPSKLNAAAALLDRGVDLKLITDNLEMARRLRAFATARGLTLPVLIEIDSDGHRGGVRPDDPLLLEIAAELAAGPTEVRGVMTHAGSSYDLDSTEAIRELAEQERASVVRAAERLRAAGHATPTVSVGSTPTALFARHLSGVTELRVGVYTFFDLVMLGLGACSSDEIALTVLTSVVGHQAEKGWVLTDAGWMALSRDRGTARQRIDQGYGWVCDLDGVPLDGILVSGTNQEHGIVTRASASGPPLTPEELPVGTLLRILPNHACATAAQHEGYAVVRGGRRIETFWTRFRGW